MSPRNLYYLLGLIVLLLFVYLIAQKHSQPPGVKETLLTPLGNSEIKEADRLEIFWGGQADKKMVLRKKDGFWEVILNFPKPAKGFMVENILKEFADLSGELRVKGQEWFPSFKLTDKDALHVTFYRGERTVFGILIGKRGPHWDSTFVRLPESDEIFLVYDNLLARFEIWKEAPEAPSDKGFVDLKVLELPPQKIKELVFFWEGKELWRLRFKKEKDKEKWIVIKHGKEEIPDQEETEKILREHLVFFGKEVRPVEEFKDQKGELRFETRLGRKGTVEIAPAKDPKFYFFKHRGYVYMVESGKVEVLKMMF